VKNWLTEEPFFPAYSVRPAHRGASSRDVTVAERDAAPAGGIRNPAPGRLRGPALRTLRPVCEGLAVTAWARSAQARKRGPRPVMQSADCMAKPRWSAARRAGSVIARVAPRKVRKDWTRLAALHLPSACPREGKRKRTRANPAPTSRIRAAKRWLRGLFENGCQVPERSSPRRRGPITTGPAVHEKAEPQHQCTIDSTRRTGPRLRGDDKRRWLFQPLPQYRRMAVIKMFAFQPKPFNSKAISPAARPAFRTRRAAANHRV
jgi:hypothetical protein